MTPPKIPKGWRKLRVGEFREKGDKLGFRGDLFRRWVPLAGCNAGSIVYAHDSTVTIRRQSAARKRKK